MILTVKQTLFARVIITRVIFQMYFALMVLTSNCRSKKKVKGRAAFHDFVITE